MGNVYGNRFSRPLGVNDQGMGGAGLNLGIEALIGQTDMITVIDDFNGWVKGTDSGGGSTIFEDSGWVLTDVGSPSGDEIAMNDISNVDYWAPSCLYMFTGTADDAGFNMQLDLVNGAVGTLVGLHGFPHLSIPETDIGAAVMDNHTWVFACRAGFRADLTTTGSGNWDSKAYIGWAAAGDTSVLDASSGLLDVTTEAGPHVGFHALEDGSLRGLSQRTATTAYAAGTNYVEIVPAGGLDGTVANGSTAAGDTAWFDLAIRMNMTDISASSNGTTEFFYRRITPATAPGRHWDYQPSESVGPWIKHATTLTNQCPNHSVALVPTIEVVNGPTTDVDGVLLLDSWLFGVSRWSRFSR